MSITAFKLLFGTNRVPNHQRGSQSEYFRPVSLLYPKFDTQRTTKSFKMLVAILNDVILWRIGN